MKIKIYFFTNLFVLSLSQWANTRICKIPPSKQQGVIIHLPVMFPVASGRPRTTSDWGGGGVEYDIRLGLGGN